MKTMGKLLFILFAFAALTNTACKKDDDPKSCIYVTELQEETDALTAAATAYGTNPTTANCQAFVAAYEAYLNEAEQLVPCATEAGQGAELQAAIDDAQAQLNLIQC